MNCQKDLFLFFERHCSWFLNDQGYIYLYNGFPNPSLYQSTILTRSVGDDGVILHGKLVNIPETDCIRVTGTGKKEKTRKIKDDASIKTKVTKILINQ